MAKLLHFINGNKEFVYILEGDDDPESVKEIEEYLDEGYELLKSVEINDDDVSGFPTERPLRP